MASKLIQKIQSHIRARHYSYRTEQTYLYWIKYFIRFHRMKHPTQMGEQEIRQFLDALAVERNVTVNTQRTALNALSFLYHRFYGREPMDFSDYQRAKTPKKLPTVLSRQEMVRLFHALAGSHQLCAGLMYGSGLRVMEVVRLRVHDIDYDKLSVLVRNGKGNKSRMTTLVPEIIPKLQAHTGLVKGLFECDTNSQEWSGVYLPYPLDKKYPNAPFEFGW